MLLTLYILLSLHAMVCAALISYNLYEIQENDPKYRCEKYTSKYFAFDHV